MSGRFSSRTLRGVRSLLSRKASLGHHHTLRVSAAGQPGVVCQPSHTVLLIVICRRRDDGTDQMDMASASVRPSVRDVLHRRTQEEISATPPDPEASGSGVLYLFRPKPSACLSIALVRSALARCQSSEQGGILVGAGIRRSPAARSRCWSCAR